MQPDTKATALSRTISQPTQAQHSEQDTQPGSAHRAQGRQEVKGSTEMAIQGISLLNKWLQWIWKGKGR